MAILQLSRITHRKGLGENLPQLAGAELGWVLDERKLFIGNGTVVDGAPVVGNTEILTEFSDILGMSSTYTYKGEAAGYVTVTGDGTDIVRSLQAKFDDFASVKDFGAVGDGFTDDTDAINRALYELFCRESDPAARRSLYFPAGVYRVTGTIKIPPHAKLWGEGLTSSIIEFIAGDDAVASTMVVGDRYAISDLGTTTPAEWTAAGVTVTPAVDVVFVAIGTAPGTGLVRGVDAQVVETADSLHQTGLNLGSNSAELPTGIEMNAMAIHSTEENTLLKLDSVSSSGFSYLGLRGPRINPSAVVLLGYGTAAIEIATSVSSTHDITVSKLDTQGTTYGLKATGDAKGIVLENSGLDLHYKGVYITNPLIGATSIVGGARYKIVDVNTTDFVAIGAEFNREGVTFTATGPGTGIGNVISLDDPGPTGVVVSRNIFDNIAQEGVHFENTLFNSTGYNVFYDVGNALAGISSPLTPVITMETDQCVSIGDLFAREDEDVQPRVALLGNGGIFTDGSHSIHLGSYERQGGLEAQLGTGLTDEVLMNTLNTISNSYRVDYSIANAAHTSTRMGSMQISVSDAVVTFSDEYTEAGTTIGIVLEAATIGNNDSAIQFTSTEDAVINFSVVRLD